MKIFILNTLSKKHKKEIGYYSFHILPLLTFVKSDDMKFLYFAFLIFFVAIEINA